jgi:hypothetical protein
MHSTALHFPLTVPPWKEDTTAIQVLPKPQSRRVGTAALNRPQSKWTVIIAIVLSVLIHVAAVAIVQPDVDRPPVATTENVSGNPTSAD